MRKEIANKFDSGETANSYILVDLQFLAIKSGIMMTISSIKGNMQIINYDNYKKLKFFVYLRKSQDAEDRQVESIPGQKKELQEIINNENLKIVDVYEEQQSAFEPGRPKFNDMLDRIEKGEAEGIISWATSRIARNPIDSGRFLYLLGKGKIKILKTKGKNFFNTSDDKFTLGIDFTVDKKFSDNVSDGVKRGNRIKFFDKKEWGNMAKPGYKNLINPETKVRYIGIDPERFPILQKTMKAIIYDGYTPMQALEMLNKEFGYLTPRWRKQGGRPMAKSQWYKTLADPYYYGLMVKNLEGEKVENHGVHTPMLTKKEFDILQIRIGHKKHHSRPSLPYKEFLKCKECGGAVTAEEKWQIICPNCHKKFAQTKSRDCCRFCQLPIEKMENPTILRYVYYTCVNHKHGKGCKQKPVRQELIDDSIMEVLKKYELDPDFTRWALKYLHEVCKQEGQDQKTILTNLHKSLEDCQKQKHKLLELKISPKNINGELLDDDEYLTQKQELKGKERAYQEQINALGEKEQEWVQLTEQTFEFACHAPYWFEHGDVAQKTKIVSQLCSNLYLHNKKLLIESHKHWFLIEKAKKSIFELKKKFEPSILIDDSDKFYSSEAVSSEMCRL